MPLFNHATLSMHRREAAPGIPGPRGRKAVALPPSLRTERQSVMPSVRHHHAQNHEPPATDPDKHLPARWLLILTVSVALGAIAWASAGPVAGITVGLTAVAVLHVILP